MSPELCGNGEIARIVYALLAPFTLLAIDT